MASLGQELKRERELRGISLKEISNTTRISLKFLEALEEDRLEVLPGEFFIRGILRAYAKNVGLDEDYVMNKLQEIWMLREPSQDLERMKKLRHPPFPRKNRVLLYIILLVIAFAALLSLYFVLRSMLSTSTPTVSQQTVVAEPSPPPAEKPSPAVAEEKEVDLEISFLEQTWIQVYADGEKKLDGLMNQGDKFSVTAFQELVLNLGNAGGLTYTLNDAKGKPFGSRGAVVKNIRITLENYREYLLSEEESEGVIPSNRQD